MVILSAFVPTLIAQRLFQPDLEGLDDEVEEAAGEEDLATLHRPHHRPAAPRTSVEATHEEDPSGRP